MGTRTQLHLNAFLMSTGHHEASWRLPQSDAHAGTSLQHFAKVTATAERGRFDSVFFADSPVLFSGVGRRPVSALEPTVLLAALAATTTHIGLIATASTSYNEPYNLARRFASLDHLSGGRAGWNVVTTAGGDAARNFGLDDQPAHAARYERAAEFLDVAQKLWDSWQDDAIVADKALGEWAVAERVQPVEHRGRHFSVAGALDVPRSPQGRPVLVQAGSSESGKDLAARYAEAVFTAHQSLDSAIGFANDLRARASRVGRSPDALRILPGIVPIIGSTEAEARAKEQQLDDLIRPEFARNDLAALLRVDPSELAFDAQLPADLPAEDDIEGAKSRYTLIVDLARSENLTVRQLIGRLGGGRGHYTAAGTPEQIADLIETWFTAGAADGFNVMPASLPDGLDDFVEHVVPILQARGLFREEYTGTTLREHYGLARPEVQRDGVRAPELLAS